MRDMVLSLVVILLAAWVIYLFVPHEESKKPVVKQVSYRVELDSARRAAPYPVAAPEGLGKDWRATSVKYEPDGEHQAAWHLGFMAPDDQYAAVEQSSVKRPDKFVEDVTQNAAKTSRTKVIGDKEWTLWKGSKYNALVREEPKGEGTGSGKSSGKGGGKDGKHKGPYTTVVTGTASYDRLAQLAGALTGDGGRSEAERGTQQAPAGGPASTG